ncbi:hypothetical protein BC833DRAFT_598497 [Globomyces pollinis-pini]|nr:hypothetical protein BC833DRAFT_598497 [Globomyces pollinis-pini]
MIQDRLKRPQKPSIGKSESQNNIIPEQTSTRIMGQIRKQKQDHEPAPLKFVTGPPSTEHWKPDKMAKECNLCGNHFTFFTRRHHCRRCGDIFCLECCSQIVRLDQDGQFHPSGVNCRVCDPCHKEYLSHLIPLRVSDLETSDEDGALSITTGLDINSRKVEQPDIAETPIGTVPNDWTWSTF